MYQLLLALLLVSLHLPAQAEGRTPIQADFEVFCYHDVRDDVHGDLDEDQYAVSTEHLRRHFSWLRDHGYQPVDIDAILAAQAGEKPLPEKAVLLTFDDGYESFYSRIYPLLKLFNFPAVYALVGKWLDAPAGSQVKYGNKLLPRAAFLSPQQIAEMSDSGLVEFASHSYDLHQGVLANPQDNVMPAMVTRIYDRESADYEDSQTYRTRIHSDLAQNSLLIERLTGERPRVMVWPYGAYSRLSQEIASELGMPISMTLDAAPPSVQRLGNIGRHLIEANITEAGLIAMLQRKPNLFGQRIVHVDMDYLYDDDPAQLQKNLSRLLDRIKSMQISTVYLQAFADPDGDGNADALYFPNRHLPLRADLFSRVSWQLKTRANVAVYAWMPVLAFDLPDRTRQDRLRVRGSAGLDNQPGVYRRLSPFNPEARKLIHEIYADLAVHTAFDGLLFHDDLLLTDFEDSSKAALQVYQKDWGLSATLDAIRANPEQMKEWSAHKTRWLIDFSLALADTVKHYRPKIKTARNLYAGPVLQPESETWFAQNYQAFLNSYDYTAVMAMPYMEGASDARSWLNDLLQQVKAVPGALQKTVFELQSRNWKNARNIPDSELAAQMQMLLDGGLRHIGYYPDDFIEGFPRLDIIRPVISISDYPYTQ